MTVNKLYYGPKSPILLIVLGCFWSVTFSLFYYFHTSYQLTFYMTWAAVCGLSCLLADNGQRRWSLVLYAILVGALIAMLFNWTSSITDSTLEGRCLLGISFYALLCLQQIYHQMNRICANYESYFEVVWNNIPLMIIVCTFVGLVWGVLWLCAALFSFVGFALLSHFFSNTYFIIVMTSFLVVTGSGIAYQSEKLIVTLRHFFLLMCKFIFPLLMLVLLVCLVPIILSIVTPIKDSDQNWFISLVECLCLLNLIFFNGLYQSADFFKKLPRWYRTVLQMYPVLALLAALYLIYSVFSKTQHINTHDILFFIVSMLFALYAIGYIGLYHIGRTNIVLAYLVIVVMLGLNNPITQHYTPIQLPPAREYVPAPKPVIYQLNKAGLTWLPQQHTASSEAVIVAEQDAPIGICRASCGGEAVIGSYQHGRCVMRCHQKLQRPQQFDVLTQKPNAPVIWEANLSFVFANSSHYPVRVEENDSSQIICRGIVKNRISVGVENTNHLTCVGFDPQTGAEQQISPYQLLWVHFKN